MIRSRATAPALQSAAIVAAAAFGLSVAAAGGIAAQPKPKEQAKPAGKTAAPAAAPQAATPAPPAPPQIIIPDAGGLAILIDNTLVALSQANLTGNYSVLRDLGAPEFQRLNSPQRLAEIFATLRARNLNFSPLVLYQPKLASPAAIDDKGFLRTVGFYETQPLQVHFNLAFQPVAGSWRLYEISVWTATPR